MAGRNDDFTMDFDHEVEVTPFVDHEELIECIDENNLDDFISLMLTDDFDYEKILLHLIVDKSKQDFFSACLAVTVSKYEEKCEVFIMNELKRNNKLEMIEKLFNGEIDRIIMNSKSKNRKIFNPRKSSFVWSRLILETNDSNFIKQFDKYYLNKTGLFINLEWLIKYTNDVELLDHYLNFYYKKYNMNELNDKLYACAIREGNEVYFRYFLKKGCSVKEFDIACFSEMQFDKEKIKYLLENGAYIYTFDGNKNERIPDKVLTNIIKCLL